MERNSLDFPVGFCRLAVDKIQILGFCLALALVVLDTNFLVYSLVNCCLELVACLVGLVDLDLVGLPMGILVILVANHI